MQLKSLSAAGSQWSMSNTKFINKNIEKSRKEKPEENFNFVS